MHGLVRLLEGTPCGGWHVAEKPLAVVTPRDAPVRLHLDHRHAEAGGDHDEVGLALYLPDVLG